MSIPLPGRLLPVAPGTFRALRHRNFRLLWLGQLVSLTGRWMQSVAQGWLVLRLGDSPFYLGLVGFCNFLPVLLFGLVAGVAADHLPRRRALIWVQGAAMAFALLLALLTWTGAVRIWHVAVLAFGLGLAGAFDIPVRQSLLQDLVGREDLPNAIALNSFAFNGARLVGPALAGPLLAAFGEGLVFFLNGLSYLAVLAGLWLMRTDPAPAARRRSTWFGEIRRGLRWALRSARPRALLGLAVAASVFGFPYSILLPSIARDVVGVGSTGLGLMLAATGLGAMTGALFLAGRGNPARSLGTVTGAMTVLGAGLVAFSFSTTFVVSLPLLFFVGGAMMVQLASSNTQLQLMAPPDLRGRIVSLFMLAFLGMAPAGSLLAGWIADAFGSAVAVRAGGVACLIVGLAATLRIPAISSGSRGSPRRSRSGP